MEGVGEVGKELVEDASEFVKELGEKSAEKLAQVGEKLVPLGDNIVKLADEANKLYEISSNANAVNLLQTLLNLSRQILALATECLRLAIAIRKAFMEIIKVLLKDISFGISDELWSWNGTDCLADTSGGGFLGITVDLMIIAQTLTENALLLKDNALVKLGKDAVTNIRNRIIAVDILSVIISVQNMETVSCTLLQVAQKLNL